jgi:hypothetical protein
MRDTEALHLIALADGTVAKGGCRCKADGEDEDAAGEWPMKTQQATLRCGAII